ncbi:MAG: aminopeptidase P family protein [Actinomycetota bacterium]|nr:aminopeptidase P family protein [Actinomycetota bacterium]
MRPMQLADRLDRLRARFAGAGVDVLVVTNLVNVRYLTGFTGSAGVLAVGPSDALLTTDGRYRTQSEEQLAAAGASADIFVGDLRAQRDALKAFVSGAGRVGFEADHVSWADSRSWVELLGEIVPASGLVEALREVKDPGEIDRIARAAAVADAALGSVLAMLDTGVSEAELALALDSAMRRHGAESSAFETIVASGPNSAKPHHRPTGRTIGPGELVVVDFGATVEGYRSDMTRTFCVGGEPSGELARVVEVVRESQARGTAAVAPGAECREVDRVCREVVAAAGWAERFEHGTGHGVGLDIHEAPALGPLGTATLATGMVVTVEPGVYLPGLGGARIEDTLVVTETGSRALSAFGKSVAP